MIVIGVYNKDNYSSYREAEKDGAVYLTERIEPTEEAIENVMTGIKVACYCLTFDTDQLNMQVVEDDKEYDVLEYLDMLAEKESD